MTEDLGVRGLDGKVAIITGGGQGIGLGVAQVLAARGASVAVLDVSEEHAASGERTLREGGARAVGMVADVRDRESVSAAVSQVVDRFGRLGIVVNNAGVSILTSFLDADDEAWNSSLSVNLTGTFLTAQVAAKLMVAHGWPGSIVNISSIAAFGYTAQHPIYAATKAAIVALTRDMAYELGPEGIRVNSVAPGPTATPMTASRNWGTRFDRALRLRRWGTPADVGRAVAFLASDEASFITGQTLRVSGGADLRTLDPGDN